MKFAQFKCHLQLLFCSVSISFVEILIGGSYVFSSTLLTQLREPSSNIKLNIEQESWITSISMLLTPVGLIITGITADRIGRIKALQISFIPMTLSWLTLTFANSYTTIMIGRILLGYPFGVSSCMCLYIAEVFPVHLRALHTAGPSLFVGIGMMLVCVLSMYFRWQTIAGVLCALSVGGFVVLFWVPEPSKWLRAKGRDAEADRVDAWFDLGRVDPAFARSGSGNPSREVGVNRSGDGGNPSSKASCWSLYAQPTVWKPTLVTLTFFVCQHCSGVYVLMFYTSDVLRDFRLPWDSATVAIFLAAARVLGGLCFGMLHRIKRRNLLVISGALMAASLAFIIAYITAFQHVEHPPYAGTVVVAFVAFMFFGLLGIVPMPWILSGEVFPIAISGVMNGFIQTFGYILWFLVVKMYPSLVLQFGITCIWSIFTLFCSLNILFAIFIMPETKGKSLDEILSYFESEKKTKNLYYVP
ncbi:facilitated trehalose transporter Tret1-like [Acyrthosiphon pisum]|uniref:Major facilitator superfamily (MFS) profile domain-containing protein n=1 Tax=Acyrthosiphon pisum TaxID=7029 RepID=A0A8R2AA31_ACYPI|nr:facilitated trehalose transporter Tret1-like [Acyrthosiphon pisum]|eukprot:XP_003245538.1 PREDICTED: facilitated trehalose transporter Tret1-like [Acyrthosiphon pisum]